MSDKEQRDFASRIKHMVKMNRCSPDICKIEERQWHYVFAYGTFKNGFSRHGALMDSGAEYIGSGLTHDGDYSMYQSVGLTSVFPIIFRGTQESKYNGRIKGEIYRVPPSCLFMMDFVENNTEMYTRERRKVQVYTDNKGIVIAKEPRLYVPWIYVGVRAFWNEYISQGHVKVAPRNFFTNKKPYFDYTYKGE